MPPGQIPHKSLLYSGYFERTLSILHLAIYRSPVVTEKPVNILLKEVWTDGAIKIHTKQWLFHYATGDL